MNGLPSKRALSARPLFLLLPLLAFGAVAACKDKAEKEAPGAASTASSAAASAAPKASESAAPGASAAPAAPAPEPVCKVEGQKVWTKGVNAATGITAVELPDGTDALGFAIGNTPYVATVGAGGAGKMQKVTVDPGSAFATAPKAPDGVRVVFRVTPVKIEGATVRAFVDYRDEVKAKAVAGHPEVAKTRKVVCGPVDKPDTWVAWEGPAYLDDPKHAKDPLAALKGAELLKAGAQYKEVRDCRSFYDAAHDDEWIVGSELVIEGDGAKAQANLFVAQGKGAARATATSMPVTTSPWKMQGFDTPVSHELADTSFLVAARAPGKLLAMIVGHDKKPVGGITEYKGTFQMPDLASDGKDDVLSTAVATGKDGLALRSLRIPGDTHAMPAAFTQVLTDEDESKTEGRPEFLRDAKGQRWLAYVEDAEKGKGTLEIIPITAAFRAAGKPHAVTTGEEKATEARLFSKKGGGFIVAYLRDAGAQGLELVTEDLSCEVKQ